MSMPDIAIASLYLPVFGLILIVITMRVGTVRMKNGISLGDNGDQDLLKLIRGHGNFVELVPLSLLLLIALELNGAGDKLLHGLYVALLVGRLSHYCQITGILKPMVFRPVGMVLTFAVLLVASIALWIG